MINEANGVPSHAEMVKLVARYHHAHGMTVATEYTLPNGKRADVVHTTEGGIIHITEVKRIGRPYLLTNAFGKYHDHCHYLWLALPEGDRTLDPRYMNFMSWTSHEDRIGLARVTWLGLEIVRPAQLLHAEPLNARLTVSRLRSTVAGGELAGVT